MECLYICKCGATAMLDPVTLDIKGRICILCGRMGQWLPESEADSRTNLEYLNDKVKERTRNMNLEQSTRYLRHYYGSVLAMLAGKVSNEVWRGVVDGIRGVGD